MNLTPPPPSQNIIIIIITINASLTTELYWHHLSPTCQSCLGCSCTDAAGEPTGTTRADQAAQVRATPAERRRLAAGTGDYTAINHTRGSCTVTVRRLSNSAIEFEKPAIDRMMPTSPARQNCDNDLPSAMPWAAS